LRRPGGRRAPALRRHHGRGTAVIKDERVALDEPAGGVTEPELGAPLRGGEGGVRAPRSSQRARCTGGPPAPQTLAPCLHASSRNPCTTRFLPARPTRAPGLCRRHAGQTRRVWGPSALHGGRNRDDGNPSYTCVFGGGLHWPARDPVASEQLPQTFQTCSRPTPRRRLDQGIKISGAVKKAMEGRGSAVHSR
jgi:hypothetical protein